MASTSAPASFATRARTGLAPVPVPPPRPVTITTTSAPRQSLRKGSPSSCAAARPISGSPPAPRPRVSLAPSGTTVSTEKSSSDWMSVLRAAKLTPTNPPSAKCWTALQPAPPTPKTLRVSSLVAEFLLGTAPLFLVLAGFQICVPEHQPGSGRRGHHRRRVRPHPSPLPAFHCPHP